MSSLRLFNRLRGSKGSSSPSPPVSDHGIHTRSDGVGVSHSASLLPDARPRSGTDPETCLEVFKTHWNQACGIINKRTTGNTSSMLNIRRSAQEEVEAVMHYVDQMALLLASEEEQDGGQGPILQYLLMEDLLEYLLNWMLEPGQYADRLKQHQLQMYEMLLDQSNQSLLVHKPVIRPLLKLLSACRDHPNPDIERNLILVLHQLSVCLTHNTQILELLFNAGTDHGPARFLMFSILIPYVHREGHIGDQARNALLLIMSLSLIHDHIGQYIAEHSDFCPVLATGLSGLYSSLPRKISIPSDDWYQLTEDDVNNVPELVMFLNSLEFCNAVVQVSHPLVKSQLLSFIYNGFLVPVIAPALHQGSMDEVISATAYLQLFIQRITEPALMNTFLRFLMTEKHDDLIILESLITRINSSSRLCMVSLGLFQTLVSLNCEDVMFELVFRHLIPCSHVMVSQRRAVRDLDLYGKTAEKFLSLKPTCCVIENSEAASYSNLDQADTISLSPSSPPSPVLERPKPQASSFRRTFSFRSRKRLTPAPVTSNVDVAPPRNYIPQMQPSNGQGGRNINFETFYMDYLVSERHKIYDCLLACYCWGCPYDGENPSPDAPLMSGFNKPVLMQNVDNSNKVIKNKVSPTSDDHQDVVVHSVDIATNCITNNDNHINEQSANATSPVQQTSKTSKTPSTEQSSYAESQTSDSDSGVSASCFTTEGISSTGDPASRSDSPLVDNFENADFKAFLLSLKRVKTPVEFCDNIEDSLSEIDSIISELRSIDNSRSDGLPTIVDYNVVQSPMLIKPEAIRPSVLNTNPEKTTKQDSLSPMQSDPALACIGNEDIVKEDATTPSTEKPATFFSTKLTSTAPSIGLFLSTLLSKLENMMSNTLYVNLLLTGLIARLACYPQPLLRSFLLHPSLVFQPTIKSLFQVLSSVKHRVDCHAHTVENFELFLIEARRYLAWRDDNLLALNEMGRERSPSIVSLPANMHSIHSSSRNGVIEPAKEKNRGLFSDFFGRSGSMRKRQSNQQARLQIGRKGSFHYINRAPSPSPSVSTSVEANLELIRTKNAVYCAVVLDEFLKELAAISQEHAVVCECLSTKKMS